MQNKEVTIQLNGRDETLVFTTLALQEVQERFGGVQELTEGFQGPQIEEWDLDDPEVVRQKQEAQAKASKQALSITWWLVALLANQGRMLKDIDAPLLTEKQVALYMIPGDMEPLLQACMDAIALGLDNKHAAHDDSPADPILEEVEKNGEGAGK